MNRETAEKMLALISAAHGTDVTDTTVDAWHLILHDLDDEAAIRATVSALRQSHFAPKPADILSAAVPPMLDAHAAYLEWRRELRDDAPILDQHGNRRYRLPVWSNPLIPAAGLGLGFDDDEYATRKAYTAAYDRLTSEYQATGHLPRGVEELPAHQAEYNDESLSGKVLAPGSRPRLEPRDRASIKAEKANAMRRLLAEESSEEKEPVT